MVLVVALSQSTLLALGGPENVLVIRSTKSAMSGRVADYYMSRRGIPQTNLLTIDVIEGEEISPSDYQSKIEQPIRSFLASNGLTDQIQYIVLTKGIPHLISNDPLAGVLWARAVDSVIASMDLVNPFQIDIYDDTLTPPKYYGSLFANRYWNATEPFSHAKYGGYLVTRLDGYTEADARALVDRALMPQSLPYRILLDTDPAFGVGDPSVQPIPLLNPDGESVNQSVGNYKDFNADLIRASQILAGRPDVVVQLEATTAFVEGSGPLSGYISWGSNDHQYNAATYRSVAFAAGDIAETAVSTSAGTFRQITWSQSLIADLIAQGATGAKGYATEPFLFAISSPSVLMDCFTSGRNLAESYYAASRCIGWKDIVLGDPLFCFTGNAKQKISEAKGLPDGSLVTLTDQVVSAGTNAFGDRFYIQDKNRSSGIQVYLGRSFPGIVERAIVSVRGVLTTRSGERALSNASVIGSIQSITATSAPKTAETKRTRVELNQLQKLSAH